MAMARVGVPVARDSKKAAEGIEFFYMRGSDRALSAFDLYTAFFFCVA